MHRVPAPTRPGRVRLTAGLFTLGALGIAGAAPRRAAAQMPESPAASGAEQEEVPHPFFTHMGIPEGRGVFNLRASALSTRADGRQVGDFAFHLETGITERIGLHIRNDQFIAVPRTEAMFQFAAVMSKDGMSGFAPLIEFNFPTRSGAGRRVNTLAGYTVALVNPRVSFNHVVHYDPREDGGDASAALVTRVAGRFFPVIEVLGEGGRGMRPIANLLAGLKLRVREGVNVGLAYQVPITSNKDFASQVVAQPDYEWSFRR